MCGCLNKAIQKKTKPLTRCGERKTISFRAEIITRVPPNQLMACTGAWLRSSLINTITSLPSCSRYAHNANNLSVDAAPCANVQLLLCHRLVIETETHESGGKIKSLSNITRQPYRYTVPKDFMFNCCFLLLFFCAGYWKSDKATCHRCALMESKKKTEKDSKPANI